MPLYGENPGTATEKITPSKNSSGGLLHFIIATALFTCLPISNRFYKGLDLLWIQYLHN